MHDTDPDPLITISAAAGKLGIDRSVLSRQIKAGAVRSYGQKVRFSEVLADRAANIDLTRSGRREGRGEHENQRRSEPRASSRASDRASPDARPAEEPDDGPEMVEVDGRLMTTAQARAMKETYLALLRKLEFEVAERVLVDRAAAEKLFFDTAREYRDAWQSWPARVAITMADEIRTDPRTGKVDARSLVAVLTTYVRQHLAEMGEPEAGPLSPEGA